MGKKKKGHCPRQKKFNRAKRLQSAKSWLEKYRGKDLIKGYMKNYGVDRLCALTELELSGIKFDNERKEKEIQKEISRLEQRRKSLEKLQEKKLQEEMGEKWSDSDSTFFYIAGYTEGGAPFGVTWEEMGLEPYEEIDKL